MAERQVTVTRAGHGGEVGGRVLIFEEDRKTTSKSPNHTAPASAAFASAACTVSPLIVEADHSTATPGHGKWAFQMQWRRTLVG